MKLSVLDIKAKLIKLAIKLYSTSPKVVMFLKILTCCALYLVQVVYNIAGANGGNYPVPPPET